MIELLQAEISQSYQAFTSNYLEQKNVRTCRNHWSYVALTWDHNDDDAYQEDSLAKLTHESQRNQGMTKQKNMLRIKQ